MFEPTGVMSHHAFHDREAVAFLAALFAVTMLANADKVLNDRLQAFRKAQADKVLAMKLPEV